MITYNGPVLATESPRVELFRLLGDEDRLRLLALCAHEELAVGELAELLGESQPQVSRKVQPLRQAGLLLARKDGTRTLLSAELSQDSVVQSAVDEGRRLCLKDGSLARVAAVVRAREDEGRRFFEAGIPAPVTSVDTATGSGFLLPVLGPLLGNHGLCVDVGAGEGTLLPVLSPLFGRVIAVDRSAARLARCAATVASGGLDNVRLLEGSAFEGPLVHEEVTRLGGADVVMVVRTLHHAARPQDAVAACARLLKAGGRLVIVDYLPHEQEQMRELGDVWLGFPPSRLSEFVTAAGLVVAHQGPLPLRLPLQEPDAGLPLQVVLGVRPNGAMDTV